MNQGRAIIAVWNRANSGKTETLRYLAFDLLAGRNPILTEPESFAEGDFQLVVEVGGVVVGIVSNGDPGYDLEARLRHLIAKEKVQLIFCASRTRGETVHSIDQLGDQFGYERVWTTTYLTDRNFELVNRLKARHLRELAQELGFLREI